MASRHFLLPSTSSPSPNLSCPRSSCRPSLHAHTPTLPHTKWYPLRSISLVCHCRYGLATSNHSPTFIDDNQRPDTMKYHALAVLAALGSAIAQGVTDKIAPTAPAPPGCKPTVNGKFEIAIVELSNKLKRDHVIKVRGADSRQTPGHLSPKARLGPAAANGPIRALHIRILADLGIVQRAEAGTSLRRIRNSRGHSFRRCPQGCAGPNRLRRFQLPVPV